MRRIRVLVSIKQPWIRSTTSFHKITHNEMIRDQSLAATLSLPFCLPTLRSIHSSGVNRTTATTEIKRGFLLEMFYKIGLPDPAHYRRKLNGHLLYENTVSSINYVNFFTDLKLPDTFYSWFVITELHVWMLMIRFMGEGKQGREMRNNIVEAMWADVNKRKSKFKNANAAILTAQVKELSQQFNAAIIAYDEGIMSDDKVLAGALWRRLFQCECNDPQHIEKLLVYVRKQMNELDRMPSSELLSRKSVQWVDYKNP